MFPSYKFTSTTWTLVKYHFRSLDTWLDGVCKSHCDEHPWHSDALNYLEAAGKRSIFCDACEEQDCSAGGDDVEQGAATGTEARTEESAAAAQEQQQEEERGAEGEDSAAAPAPAPGAVTTSASDVPLQGKSYLPNKRAVLYVLYVSLYFVLKSQRMQRRTPPASSPRSPSACPRSTARRRPLPLRP